MISGYFFVICSSVILNYLFELFSINKVTKFLSPLEDTKSPIDNVLAKNGATPYHVCYCVKNISKIVEKLREAGFIPIGAVAKSEPLEGNVCFMFSSDIGLIELIEYPKTKN